ncbi:MAG: YihY/virulence factor BrkB family protein, partial [Bacteroidales bacterium]|nr:YihY/virulence factor BrkB family protein [Bacteroidales bacterium]
QSGLFGFISMFSFFWIVIGMMLSVRQVFNNVWKVEKERNFLKLIGVVFGILILTPFVILLFSSASIVYTHILDLIFPESDITDSVKSFLGWVIFAAGAIGIISMMYKWIPGTKVYYRHALKAASFSGVIFTVLQFLYLETQVMVTKVSAVYGVLAALPLFMSWMNLSWTIILYGAELTYAFQNVDKHNVSNEQLEDFIEDARRSRKRYDDVSDIVHDVENTKQK